MKKFLLLLLVSLILTSCYTNGDTLIAIKEAHPDSEIYQIDIGKFGSGYIRTTNKAFLQAAIEVIEEIDSHLVEVNEKN